MIKKHEIGGVTSPLNDEGMVYVVESLYSIVNNCISLVDNCNDYIDGIYDEFDLSEALEEWGITPSRELTLYASSSISRFDSVNRLMRDLFTDYSGVYDNGEEFFKEADTMLLNKMVGTIAVKDYFSTSDILQLSKMASEICNKALLMIYYEFGLDSYVDSSSDIDAIFSMYCDRCSKNVEDEVKAIRALLCKYTVDLPVFKFKPDSERVFLETIGVYVCDLHPYKDYITTQLIIAVIDGVLDPSDLFEYLYNESQR